LGDGILRKPVVIVYDISETKTRNKFAKELLYYGIRTQKSLFEAEVTEGELKELKKLVDLFAGMNEKDKIHLYEMEPDNYQKTWRLGDVAYLETDDFII
jgi:CRISPR-associated protein Cas2